MYIQSLNFIKNIRNLSDARLAALAGVERATVCKWFKRDTDWINIETNSILRLSQALNISPEIFFKKLPDLSKHQTLFLWDSLYPNMQDFMLAVIEKRSEALARLVQVLGFWEAKSIAGNVVLKKFEKYKRHIKPVRRKQLEVLWPLYNSNEKKLSQSNTSEDLKEAGRAYQKMIRE